MNQLTAIVLSLLLTQYAYSADPPSKAERAPSNENPTTTTLHSDILKEERSIIVHFPASYSSAEQKRYPVMYVLDGTSQDGHMAAALRALAASGESPEAIVIGIPNTRGHRERDQTPPFMRQNPDAADSEQGHGDQFLLFIETELIPFVDQQFRTSSYRMIAGHSRAGLFVLYSLLEKPQLFQARFCYSAPFHREDKLIVSRAQEFLTNNPSLKSFFYMSVGTEETDRMKAGCEAMKSLLEQQANGLTWSLNYTAGAVHGDNAQRSTPDALKKWASQLPATGDK